MSEEDVIKRTAEPITRGRIAGDVGRLGVAPGASLLVHSSLSSLGYVSGGPEAAVLGLMDAVGPAGTLVMPTFTAHLSDPAPWAAPPVPESWWQTLRETMTPFHPTTTPTRMMGAIPECFRCWPGTARSRHPQDSFAAKGPYAEEIIASHPLEQGFGEPSPLAELYRLGGQVLLLGVGFDNANCFHLSEHRADAAPLFINGAPIMDGGKRVWKTFKARAYDSNDFEALGVAFEGKGAVKRGPVGQAECRLFSIREAVDFGTEWLKTNRKRG